MRTLFIDLASHASALSTSSTEPKQGACLACVSDGNAESMLFIDHRIGDEGLMPAFDQVLKDAKWESNDLTHIACVTGPGGFTSLRMAVTLANVLADQLKIPSAGTHLSDVYAARSTQEDFFWMHATKKEALFIKGFGSCENLWPEPTLVSIDELLTSLPDQAVVAGEILPEQHKRLATKKMRNVMVDSLEAVLPAFLRIQNYGQDLLKPWYGRGW